MVGLSWYEAKAFCNWLNSQDDEYTYSLPTEQQWEAAARGKEGREYPWGTGLKKEDDRCNYAPGWNPILNRTSPVGMFPKGSTPDSDCEIHDMAGNVWEWCGDWYDKKKKRYRVLRGGGWIDYAGYCTASDRNGLHPGSRDDHVGFRLARSLK